MGECDYAVISPLPEVRNDREDFWRDPADRSEAIPPGPNETEDLECVLLEDLNLKYGVRNHPQADDLVGWPTSASSRAAAAL